MSGPLSLLGDVLMQGSRDYLGIKREDELRDKLREQAVADRNAAWARDDKVRTAAWAREDQVRNDQRNFEQTIYDKRRFDSIVDQLVRDGRISTADAKDPAKVDDALNKFGVEYRRKVEEMAEYKAALPGIIKAVGDVGGASALLTTTITADTDMQPIREKMRSAFGALEARSSELIKRGDKNLEVGAALISANMAQSRAIQSRIDELSQPPSRLELRQIAEQMAAANNNGRTPTEAQIQAEMPNASKKLSDMRYMERYQLQESLPALTRRLDVLADSVRSGTFGFIKGDMSPMDGGEANGVKPTSSKTPKQADDTKEIDDFMAAPKVSKPAAAPATDTPQPPPVSLAADDPLAPALAQANNYTEQSRKAAVAQGRLDRIAELSREIPRLQAEIEKIEKSGGNTFKFMGQAMPVALGAEGGDGQVQSMFNMRPRPTTDDVAALARQRNAMRQQLDSARNELSLLQGMGQPKAFGI